MRRCALIGLAALALLSQGCSAIPAGDHPEQDPAVLALARRDAPKLGRLGVAPLTSIGLTAEERQKGWRPSAGVAFRARDFDRALVSTLAASGSFERVRIMETGTLSEAYAQQDDFLLRVRLKDLQSAYEGRNGWWIPNILNWFFWMVPAWWVATEEFTLSATAELSLVSAESGAVLASEEIEAVARGSFDEFDRGWHFFGFVYTPLDPERWQRIAGLLFPEARKQLVVAASLRSDALLRRVTSSADYEEQRRKTLVFAVGVSRYSDGLARPELPYAAGDARAVVEAVEQLGVDGSRTELILDGAASVASVRSSLATQLGRARPGDNVLVYFAGYGSRDAAGRPLLLLHDNEQEGGALPLAELLAELSRFPGEKLVVIDAGFDGGPRCIRGGQASELAAPKEGALLLAGSAGESVLARDYLNHGLLTHRFLRALSDPETDTSAEGRVDAGELFTATREGVVAEAALLGVRQRPLLRGSTRFFLPAAQRRAK